MSISRDSNGETLMAVKVIRVTAAGDQRDTHTRSPFKGPCECQCLSPRESVTPETFTVLLINL
jgi:hypothetical protein